MRLCFGAFGRILKYCKLRANSQNRLVSVILRSVDKDCRIDDGKDWDNAVNQLLNCGTGLSNGSEMQGVVATISTSKPGESLGRIISKAQKADPAMVAAYFESEVIKLLDPNMLKLAILALKEVIDNDSVLDPDTIIDVIGNKNKSHILAQSEFVASDFFASIFLYTAVSVDNKINKDAVDDITEEFVRSFEPLRNSITLVQQLSDNLEQLKNQGNTYPSQNPQPAISMVQNGNNGIQIATITGGENNFYLGGKQKQPIEFFRSLFVVLESKRILTNPMYLECQDECVASVLDLKKMLTTNVMSYNLSDDDNTPIREMLRGCNAFLNTVHPVKADDKGYTDMNGRNRLYFQEFSEAVEKFRDVFRKSIAGVENRYGLRFSEDTSKSWY